MGIMSFHPMAVWTVNNNASHSSSLFLLQGYIYNSSQLIRVIYLNFQMCHKETLKMLRVRVPVIGKVGQREWCWQLWEYLIWKQEWWYLCHCFYPFLRQLHCLKNSIFTLLTIARNADLLLRPHILETLKLYHILWLHYLQL